MATARPRPTPRADPLPLTKTTYQFRNNRARKHTFPTKKTGEKIFVYSDSSIQALKHWRILKHIRDDHKPVIQT